MAIELLLVRHGKAEERSNHTDEATRPLTKKGIKEFTEFTSKIKDEIQTDRDVQVWTSPLKRAKQTAKILTKEWELEKAGKKDFLSSGEFEALVEDITQVSPDSRVICVGHEPILGNWVEELTGKEYSFKKGGLALIRLDEDDKAKGKLLWDMKPKSKKKRTKIDKGLRDVLYHQAEEVEQSYEAFRSNPYSPKRTHRFRVTMRKMRSVLHFVKPLIGTDSYDELNTLIKDASHRLEPLREADVLIESCGERALTEPELIDDYAGLFQHLHNERRRWMRSRLSKSIVSSFEEMINVTKESINQLTFDKEKAKNDKWDSYLEERFTSRKKKVFSLFKNADHSDYESAHDVRKKAKKLRYAAKAYEEFLSSKDVKKTKKKLKMIQDELGDICDLHINREWLLDYAERAKKPSLKEAFNTLADKQLTLKDETIEESDELNEA